MPAGLRRRGGSCIIWGSIQYLFSDDSGPAAGTSLMEFNDSTMPQNFTEAELTKTTKTISIYKIPVLDEVPSLAIKATTLDMSYAFYKDIS